MRRIGVLVAIGIGWIGVPAGTAIAQTVEYVTRDRQPIHAVRFTAKPIRVTITDRGARRITVTPSAAPIRTTNDRSDGRRQLVAVRFGSDPIRATVPETTRPRTVYGSSRNKDTTDSPQRTARGSSREEGKQETSAEQRRHLLRVRAILRQSRSAD